MATSLSGEFKFATEDNYRQFLETMGAPSGMIDNIMASLTNVIIYLQGVLQASSLIFWV